MNIDEFFSGIENCEDDQVLKDKFTLSGNFTILFSGKKEKFIEELIKRNYKVEREDVLKSHDGETLFYLIDGNNAIEKGLVVGDYLNIFSKILDVEKTEAKRRQLIQKYNFSVGIVGKGPYLSPKKRRDALLEIKTICREREIPFCIPSLAKLQKTEDEFYFYDLEQIVYYEPNGDIRK